MNEIKNFDTTLRKIKPRGYWRVEFHPSVYNDNVISKVSLCKDAIRESSVHFRGWDVPHVPLNTMDHQAILSMGDRCESWVDWHLFKSVWRFYKSGKFLCIDGLTEHWYNEYETAGFAPSPFPDLKPGTVLDVINTIYTLTEYMYFFHNLADKIPDIDRWDIKISLNNVVDNKLMVLDQSRCPIFGDYVNHVAEPIYAINLEVENSDLRNTKKCLELAKNGIERVFEYFDWEAADELVSGEQDKLVNKRF